MLMLELKKMENEKSTFVAAPLKGGKER